MAAARLDAYVGEFPQDVGPDEICKTAIRPNYDGGDSSVDAQLVADSSDGRL